jgi:hypothetical protein
MIVKRTHWIRLNPWHAYLRFEWHDKPVYVNGRKCGGSTSWDPATSNIVIKMFTGQDKYARLAAIAHESVHAAKYILEARGVREEEPYETLAYTVSYIMDKGLNSMPKSRH